MYWARFAIPPAHNDAVVAFSNTAGVHIVSSAIIAGNSVDRTSAARGFNQERK